MLTHREMDVLKLVAQGKPNKTIARELGISLATTKEHFMNIYDKLGVQSRLELLIKAIKEGLVKV